MLFIVSTNTCFGIWCFIDDIIWYKEIYKLKWREFTKPLAIFVDDIEKVINLNNFQKDFLKNYDKPWTLLVDKQEVKDKKILEHIEKLPNKEIYKKLAFRQIHNKEQKNLLGKWWYFFLTSANKSWKKEIKNIDEIKKEFPENIEIYWDDIDSKYDFSDIFEFDGNSVKYWRKN